MPCWQLVNSDALFQIHCSVEAVCVSGEQGKSSSKLLLHWQRRPQTELRDVVVAWQMGGNQESGLCFERPRAESKTYWFNAWRENSSGDTGTASRRACSMAVDRAEQCSVELCILH